MTLVGSVSVHDHDCQHELAMCLRVKMTLFLFLILDLKYIDMSLHLASFLDYNGLFEKFETDYEVRLFI